MTQGSNNHQDGSENARPAQPGDKTERNEQRANDKGRTEVAQSVEEHTEASKKSFLKPKENNSSGISKFGFNPTALINPEKTSTTPVRTLQLASEHTQEILTHDAKI